jgi:hypothetical protein
MIRGGSWPRFFLARGLGVGSVNHGLHTLQQFLW